MKHLSRLLTRLYPSEWRERYGEEFAALIEDAPARRYTAFDLLKGAIFMQLRVRNFPRLALLLSIVGLLIGFGVSYLVTPRYISTANLVIYSDVPNDLVARRMTELQTGMLSRTSLSSIIQDPRLDLYLAERQHIPLEDVIETMRRSIRIDRVTTVGAAPNYVPFVIEFTYSDQSKTQAAVQALVTKFTDSNAVLRRLETEPESSDRIQQLEARIASLERRLGVSSDVKASGDEPARAGGIQIEVVDPPSLPVAPAWPNRSVFAATGFTAGFVLALILWTLGRPTPPALRVESAQP